MPTSKAYDRFRPKPKWDTTIRRARYVFRKIDMVFSRDTFVVKQYYRKRHYRLTIKYRY